MLMLHLDGLGCSGPAVPTDSGEAYTVQSVNYPRDLSEQLQRGTFNE